MCGASQSLIQHVPDRPGHDRRYALDCSKIQRETGWSPQVDFERGLESSVLWYRENSDWVADVQSGRHLLSWDVREGERRTAPMG